MKARQIATQRIGDNNTPIPRKSNGGGGISTIFSVTIVAVLIALSLALLYVRWTMPPVTRVLEVTVLATLAPTQTPEPTAIHMPTLLPVTLTPQSTIALEHGVILAQVWLYDAPGGNKLPAGLLAGQSVIVLEHREDFVKVLWDGGETAIVGWVAERWIEIQ